MRFYSTLWIIFAFISVMGYCCLFVVNFGWKLENIRFKMDLSIILVVFNDYWFWLKVVEEVIKYFAILVICHLILL